MHPIQEYLEALGKLGLKVNKPINYLTKKNFSEPNIYALADRYSFEAPKFEIHFCYKNAYELINFIKFHSHIFDNKIKELRYCEGLMTVAGIPIEHAWVRVIFTDNTDIYIDPTKSYVLHESVDDFGDYTVMLEYTWEELIKTLLSKKAFGPYFTVVNQ